MLYINNPSIIIGKHQNVFAEINMKFVSTNNIPVIRRLSGGGTVFHDLGNLNFTFIRNSDAGKQIDFKKFTTPIIEVLHQLNIPATFSGRNDLLIEGLKFSGNAEHVYKNRTLHHGTLLFASALESLRDAIRVNSSQYIDKAVKSVRSQVTNIKNYLSSDYTIESFRSNILKHIQSYHTDFTVHEFTDNETMIINELVLSKYNTWEWNFAYSPSCTIKKSFSELSNHFKINLEIENGKIVNSLILENNIIQKEINAAISNLPYYPQIIAENLYKIKNPEIWVSRLF